MLLGSLIIVNLKPTSESKTSEGSSRFPASWTYKVTGITGQLLGDNLSPSVPRMSGKLSAASQGVGYFDLNGTFTLLQAFEIPVTGSC